MFRTRWIRKALDLPKSLGQRRRQVAKLRKPVRLMLESLEERVTPDATTCVPGSVALNFFGSAHSPEFICPVTVNDNSGGVATSGTVTINLHANNTTITLGSATVDANGIADVDVDLGKLPSNLSVGNFQLVENFSGSGKFDACSANGTLTITALSTTVVSANVTFNFSGPGTTTESGNETIPIGADASNFVVLYEGQGGHTLHIANTAINGSVGVGATGAVHADGHADIDGALDFSASDSGQIKDTGKNSAPSAIHFNDAVVTHALNTVNALSASLAGLGASIQINGTQTINESAGQLVTVNGVSYRVFNVTSYHMGTNDVLTIKGDGSGIPVVFNFGGHDDVNLSGNVNLKNGLTADQVLWNVTSSGAQVHLHGNGSNHPSLAFQGIILAPNDKIDLDNVNLIGRVFGGDDQDMQIVGHGSITAPTPVTPTPGTTSSSFKVSVEVTTSTSIVTSGTVAFDLVVGNQIIQLGTATVGANGIATLTVTNQSLLQELASLPAGSFELVLNFSGSGPFAPCSSTTTMNILPQLQSSATTTTTPTTIVIPGNGVSNFNGGPTTIPVVVTSPLGAVSEGTVTITLLTPSGSMVIGSGPVSGGAAAVPVTVPAGLSPGNFSMIESFTDTNGKFLGSNATGTLTVQPLNPLIAALELAIDAAMLANMNNPGSVGELQMFAQVFLHQPVPTSVPQLLSNIQSLLPQTGEMLFPALEFAGFLDIDLPIENPM